MLFYADIQAINAIGKHYQRYYPIISRADLVRDDSMSQITPRHNQTEQRHSRKMAVNVTKRGSWP